MRGAFVMLVAVTCVGVVLIVLLAKLLGVRELDKYLKVALPGSRPPKSL